MKMPKNPCGYCGKALPAGKQKYCGADCKQAAYRRRDVEVLGVEVAGQLRQVRRLLDEGRLPEAYGEAVDDLHELVKRAAEVQKQVISVLDYVVGVAQMHHHRTTDRDCYEAAGGEAKAMLLIEILRVDVAHLDEIPAGVRKAVDQASEAYAEGAVGPALESVLYASQVNHHWQDGTDTGADNGTDTGADTGGFEV